MIQTKGLTGAQTMLRVLAKMGVEKIFASPGSEWSPVWEALAEPGVEGMPQYLSTRHEEVAVGMASGYAKSTGKLPAVMIHTTVGSLHATMGMRGAIREQVPMVVFSGESIGYGEDEGPDPGGAVAGPSLQYRRSGEAGRANGEVELRRQQQSDFAGDRFNAPVSSRWRRPKGPTFVSLSMEHLFDKMIKDVPGDLGFAPGATADPKGIEELANLLAGAKNPVIVTEDSGRTEKSVHCLVEIAELLGCAVVETRSTGALNFPRTHPLHSGYDPRKALAGADAILLLAVIAPWHPASATPSPGATVAILDENPLRHDMPYYGYQADLCLTGEIESSLEHLLAALKKKVSAGDSSRKQRAEEIGKKNNAQRKAWRDEALALASQKPMDTRWVAHELSQVLPADAMVVEETITHRLAVHRYLDGVKPGSYFAGCVGGLGTGLSTALGVKVGQSETAGGLPDRRRLVQLRSGARRCTARPRSTTCRS